MTDSGQRDGSILTSGPSGRTVVARVLTYGQRDRHGTTWKKGCAAASMRRKLPVVLLGHDPRKVVGRVTKWVDTDAGLDVEIRLTDPDAVPDARAAQAMIADGSLRDVSIGFSGAVGSRGQGGTVYTACTVDEVSFVGVGSIPGAEIMSFRSAGDETAETAAALDALLAKVEAMPASPRPRAGVRSVVAPERPATPGLTSRARPIEGPSFDPTVGPGPERPFSAVPPPAPSYVALRAAPPKEVGEPNVAVPFTVRVDELLPDDTIVPDWVFSGAPHDMTPGQAAANYLASRRRQLLR